MVSTDTLKVNARQNEKCIRIKNQQQQQQQQKAETRWLLKNDWKVR